jgi:hypothetical protein
MYAMHQPVTRGKDFIWLQKKSNWWFKDRQVDLSKKHTSNKDIKTKDWKKRKDYY